MNIEDKRSAAKAFTPWRDQVYSWAFKWMFRAAILVILILIVKNAR